MRGVVWSGGDVQMNSSSSKFSGVVADIRNNEDGVVSNLVEQYYTVYS